MSASPATTTEPVDRPAGRPTRLLLATLAALAVAAGLVAAPTAASAATCPAAFAAPFSDVPLDHPFCREILHGQIEGWSSGYVDGSFRPSNQMTRQSAAAMLWELAAAYDIVDDELEPCTEDAFPDVPMDHPFCPYIREVVLAGVFEGYGDGSFRPTQPITRQTATAILFRSIPGPVLVVGCDADPFPDVSQHNPFCDQILHLEGTGVISGYEDGTFRPLEVVNRQHFVAMVSRFTSYL